MARPFTPERWLDDHGRTLFKYAHSRLRDRHVAEEMVQETLLAAWRGRHGFAGRSSERTWLIGILKHRLADHWRSLQRQGPAARSLESFDPSEDGGDGGREPIHASNWPEPDAGLEQRQFWRIISDCIAALPPGQARAFRLWELDGLETDEVCEILRIAPANLWVMLHRARVRMRKQLERHGFGAVPERL